MRWKISAGFFVFIFLFIIINVTGASSLGEDLISCLSDSDDLSYFTPGYLSLTNGAILEDFCLGPPNNKYLVEFTCDNGKSLAQYYPCAFACSSGKCVSELDAQNTPAEDIASNEESGNYGEGVGSSAGYSANELETEGTSNTPSCDGCFTEGKCLSKGTRFISGFEQEESYCGLDRIIRIQKTDNSRCEENYECLGNVCLEGQCKSGGNILSEASFFEKGLVRISCLFTVGEKKNSCLANKAKQWGII